MATFNLGKTALTAEGDWSSSVSYRHPAVVRHANASWLSVRDSTGSTPSDSSSDWVLLARDGERAGGFVNRDGSLNTEHISHHVASTSLSGTTYTVTLSTPPISVRPLIQPYQFDDFTGTSGYVGTPYSSVRNAPNGVSFDVKIKNSNTDADVLCGFYFSVFGNDI